MYSTRKPLRRKQIVNFMDINHVSEIVFLLAVAVGFSVGFHNIGAGHTQSGTLSTAARRGSHEVGLSKCYQKCQHVMPEYFGHPAEFKGINKFIVCFCC